MQQEVRALLDAASRPYLAAGRYPFHFARGKLRHDPVFLSLLRTGRIPDRARVLDLGCGQGLLASLLIASRAQFGSCAWPEQWPAPPRDLTLYGIELQDRVAQRARTALGSRAGVHTGNLSETALPDADVVVILDVLHYLDRQAQMQVLEQVARALRAGGLLLLRVADASRGLSFRLTVAADRLGTMLRGERWPRYCTRPLAEWMALLTGLGFEVHSEPSNQGTTFANVLLAARRRTSPREI